MKLLYNYVVAQGTALSARPNEMLNFVTSMVKMS